MRSGACRDPLLLLLDRFVLFPPPDPHYLRVISPGQLFARHFSHSTRTADHAIHASALVPTLLALSVLALPPPELAFHQPAPVPLSLPIGPSISPLVPT